MVVIACSATTTSQTGGTAPSGTGPGGTGSASGDTTAAGKPNVLFVLTDDMRFDDLQYMPNVKKLLADQGMSFANEFDNVTLCCPARTAILRGQYSHNSGVLTNGGSNGGFETAYKLGVEKDTIATAMKAAGYTTGLFGKYLNGYPDTAGNTYIPPGWDTWSSSVKGNAYGEFNYTLNQNGKQVSYGKKPEDYGTDVYVSQTKDFITQAAKDGKPFFGYTAVYAPHQPATPAPRDANLFPDAKAPRDPAFNEADVSDKPQYIQDAPVMSDTVISRIDTLFGKRIRSLQAVDQGVSGLIDTLQKNGQLANTYIVFTSDNGFHLGQHRMPSGKQTAYETDIHLPLIVRGPNVAAGSTTTAITGNVDIAPTIAALGGAKMADNPDGRSLVPWLEGRKPTDWRQAYLLEHWTEKSTTAADTPGTTDPNGDNGPQLEPGDADQQPSDATDPPDSAAFDDSTAKKDPTTTAAGRVSKAALTNIPEFQGLRADRYTYVEYVTGEKELYDLKKDPDELNNIVTTADPALVAALHQRLDDLRKCAADSCRTAEAKPLR